MKTKRIILLAMSLFGLLECTNSLAESYIGFVISKDFPKHFYCHFRSYRWTEDSGRFNDGTVFYYKGGWSSRRYAGDSYYQGGSGLEKVVASCFDDHVNEKISATGYICFPVNNNDHLTVHVTHSGSQILFNGAPPETSKQCQSL